MEKVTKKEILNPENIGQCECGNYAPHAYLVTSPDDHTTCPSCVQSFYEELVKSLKNTIDCLGNSLSLSKEQKQVMIRTSYAEAVGCSLEDLIDSGYFDDGDEDKN